MPYQNAETNSDDASCCWVNDKLVNGSLRISRDQLLAFSTFQCIVSNSPDVLETADLSVNLEPQILRKLLCNRPHAILIHFLFLVREFVLTDPKLQTINLEVGGNEMHLIHLRSRDDGAMLPLHRIVAVQARQRQETAMQLIRRHASVAFVVHLHLAWPRRDLILPILPRRGEDGLFAQHVSPIPLERLSIKRLVSQRSDLPPPTLRPLLFLFRFGGRLSFQLFLPLSVMRGQVKVPVEEG